MGHWVKKSDLQKDVLLKTALGEIVIRLSDKTPKHRDNFIQLVNQGFYNDIAFHRVIENFLVQTGDPGTRAKPSKVSEIPYTLPAELHPSLFHKRGALNAARMGDDQNPEQASSGTQFTIIQGKIYTDSTLAIAENRINNWLAYNKIINLPAHQPEFMAYSNLLKQLDTLGPSKNDSQNNIAANVALRANLIKTRLDSLAKLELNQMTRYTYPKSHRELYKTMGGAAHLDRNYVVFGAVVQGMEVVDRIAAVQTDSLDKPITDIRILSAKMIARKAYR
jgi:cyclophilin family peptidyl-prolyl cis-trans isomerase